MFQAFGQSYHGLESDFFSYALLRMLPGQEASSSSWSLYSYRHSNINLPAQFCKTKTSLHLTFSYSGVQPVQFSWWAVLFLAKGLVCKGGRERATYTSGFRQEGAL